MKVNPKSDFGPIALFSAIIAMAVGVFVLVAMWTDRTLDYWLTYFKGTEVDCPFWLSALVTLLLNGIIIAANIISEVARLVL